MELAIKVKSHPPGCLYVSPMFHFGEKYKTYPCMDALSKSASLKKFHAVIFFLAYEPAAQPLSIFPAVDVDANKIRTRTDGED